MELLWEENACNARENFYKMPKHFGRFHDSCSLQFILFLLSNSVTSASGGSGVAFGGQADP